MQGSLAQCAVASQDEIAKKSSKLSFPEAAALPVTYLTSLQSLRDYGKLTEGGRLLVIGASGGCGISSLQLAKVLKASDIVGVCSGKNEAIVRENGATDVIDYTKTDIIAHFKGEEKEKTIPDVCKFDVVYDAATGSGAGEDYKNKGTVRFLLMQTS